MASAARHFFSDRHASPEDISLPTGFRIEVAATGLDNPSCMEFDEDGNIFVGEMGSPSGSAYKPGRIVRIRPDGTSATVAEGFGGSITGMVYYEGNLFVLEHEENGRIFWMAEDGTRSLLMDGIPGGGDNPTSDMVLSHSEWLYFGQGTRTNSGVVGTDNAGWLADRPALTDIPARNITLFGHNFESADLFHSGTRRTGAFRPFGTVSFFGEEVKGKEKATGSIMRVDPRTGDLESFAWGLRAPTGLGVHPDGRIFCTEHGMQPRGSRPIASGGEYLWHIEKDKWYGWPDYEGGVPITAHQFREENALIPKFLLQEHPPIPEKPILSLPLGSHMGRFDFARSPLFGSDDTIFLPVAGSAGTGTPWAHKLLIVDVGTGDMADFAANKHAGPASLHKSGGLEHPMAVRFDRTGEHMYLLDMGVITTDGNTYQTLPNTGVLWRIRPADIV